MNLVLIMKLLIIFVGLDLFGLDFCWKIRVYVDNLFVNGMFNGNLYLCGQGDLKLIFEEFVKLVIDVCCVGVDELVGNIVFDCIYFEGGLLDVLLLDGDSVCVYNVVFDVLLYLFKMLMFMLLLDVGNGVVNIDVLLLLVQLQIDNQLCIMCGGCGDWKMIFGVNIFM